MAKLNFDLDDVQESAGFDVLPAGVYPARAKDLTIKPAKSGNGDYLEITWEVMDGPGQGRLIWDRLNLWNANQKAAKIAQQSLKKLCVSSGRGVIQDTDELQDACCNLKVKIRKSPEYGDSNEVADYLPVQGVAAPVAAAVAKPAAAGAPPWAQQ